VAKKKPKPSPFMDRMVEYNVPEELLLRALTHRSFEDDGPNNERLEFLGDAVIEVLVSEHLFRSSPTDSEGALTRRRALSVSEPTLTAAARSIDLGAAIRMSRGEERTGGRERPSILSDAFEAVTAAVYLGGGIESARAFITAFLIPLIEGVKERDFKSVFQEWAQEHLHETPTYKIVEEIGPDHGKEFRAHVMLGRKRAGEGAGHSKKEAQQAAALAALHAHNAPVEE
jgi:ribonuclease-3